MKNKEKKKKQKAKGNICTIYSISNSINSIFLIAIHECLSDTESMSILNSEEIDSKNKIMNKSITSFYMNCKRIESACL